MNKSMLCAGLLALVASQFAHAENCIWTGGGANSNWSNSANWNCTGAHTIPVDGDSIGFPDAVPRLTNNNDLVKLMAAQLLIAGPVTISGNPIGLSAGISVAVPLAAASPVVNLGIVLETNPQTFTCSGVHKALNLGGTINLNGEALTLDGACSLVLTGKITGAGSLTKNGTATAFLEGSTSNYTGVTTINAGKVRLVSSAALGASGAGNETVVNDGAALELEDVATAEDLSLSGSGISSQGALVAAAGNNTLLGDITLAGDTTIAVASAANDLTLIGDIAGAFLLTKSGPGTLVLENTTSASLEGVDGALEVDGVTTSYVVVLNTGVLAGTGVCGHLGPYSRVLPGRLGSTSPGTLSATGDLTWTGGAVLGFRLGASSALSDHIVVAGSLKDNNHSTNAFEFRDASNPPVAGVTYTLLGFGANADFVVGDFTFSYIGTGAGASMTGTFGLNSTTLTFTPTVVTSDLIFHDNLD